MSYYMAPGQGDYYRGGRGDYYRGGRGDLLGFLKGAAKTGLALVTGGPLAAIKTGAGQLIQAGGGGSSSTRISVQPPQIGPLKLGPSFQVERYQGTRGSVDFPVSADGACPRGFHLAKDGSGKCVRNRRMNPANPAALRRAIRRSEGFVQLAQRFGMQRRKNAPRPLRATKRKR